MGQCSGITPERVTEIVCSGRALATSHFGSPRGRRPPACLRCRSRRTGCRRTRCATAMAWRSIRSPAATSASKARARPRRACAAYATDAVGQLVSPPYAKSLLPGTACRKRRTKSVALYGLIDHAQHRSTPTFGKCFAIEMSSSLCGYGDVPQSNRVCGVPREQPAEMTRPHTINQHRTDCFQMACMDLEGQVASTAAISCRACEAPVAERQTGALIYVAALPTPPPGRATLRHPSALSTPSCGSTRAAS